MQSWTPDDQLIAAVRGGRCTHTYLDLSPQDRAWVVAGLTRQGCTAEHIAELLGCCVRTVRVVLADPLTAVCAAFQLESEAFADEMRLVRSELSRIAVSLGRCVTSNKRLRAAVARISCGVELCSKGHEMHHGNVYTDPDGKRWCRECHRQRQADYRIRKGMKPRTTKTRTTVGV